MTAIIAWMSSKQDQLLVIIHYSFIIKLFAPQRLHWVSRSCPQSVEADGSEGDD